MKVPLVLKIIFNQAFFKKVFVYTLMIGIALFLHHFFILFLGTFLFAYLFFHAGCFLQSNFRRFIIPLQNGIFKSVLLAFTGLHLLIGSLYIIFITLFIFSLSNLIPSIATEIRSLTNELPFAKEELQKVGQRLERIQNFEEDFMSISDQVFTDKNIKIAKQVFEKARGVGYILIQFLLALVLSYLFIVDRKRIHHYLITMKGGSFSFLYHECEYILFKIVNSFGLIFRAQASIAIVNTILTVIGYYIIGMFYNGFPYIMTLGFIVFICSFIPILGMWISSIPIAFVVYTIAGFQGVVIIMIFIVMVHIIEAYFLSPRIISSYLELPISLTFLILIISEHLFWIIGFLVGVPLFYIIMSFLKDIDIYIQNVKKVYKTRLGQENKVKSLKNIKTG